MSKPQFVYVSYIETTPEKLWQALTSSEFTKQYWFGAEVRSDWTIGSPFALTLDGEITDSGEILEADPPRRAVIRWRNEFREELKAEGYSTCTYELEPAGDTVTLTVSHRIDRPHSQLIRAVSGGWPRILSSLKTLLETGAPLGELPRASAA